MVSPKGGFCAVPHFISPGRAPCPGRECRPSGTEGSAGALGQVRPAGAPTEPILLTEGVGWYPAGRLLPQIYISSGVLQRPYAAAFTRLRIASAWLALIRPTAMASITTSARQQRVYIFEAHRAHHQSFRSGCDPAPPHQDWQGTAGSRPQLSELSPFPISSRFESAGEF